MLMGNLEAWKGRGGNLADTHYAPLASLTSSSLESGLEKGPLTIFPNS